MECERGIFQGSNRVLAYLLCQIKYIKSVSYPNCWIVANRQIFFRPLITGMVSFFGRCNAGLHVELVLSRELDGPPPPPARRAAPPLSREGRHFTGRLQAERETVYRKFCK